MCTYFSGFHWCNRGFNCLFSSRLWCHIRRSRLLPSARQQVCASHCLHRKIKQHHVDPLSFQHTSCARAELNPTTVCSLPPNTHASAGDQHTTATSILKCPNAYITQRKVYYVTMVTYKQFIQINGHSLY